MSDSARLYGERIADLYDALYGASLDTEGAVARLRELADDGPVLELGVGTGRVAGPLAGTGLKVTGLDASPEMLEKVRNLWPAVRRVEGDFAADDLGGPYSLVCVVFSTLFQLTTQAQQVRCFQRVAQALAPGGRFVVEAFVPDPGRYVDGQNTSTRHVDGRLVVLDASIHRASEQRVTAQHVILAQEGMRMIPMEIRYAWPAELDLMAQLAGLELESRTDGWHGAPFTDATKQQVSVYRKA